MRSHLGEPAHLTGPAHLHMSNPLHLPDIGLLDLSYTDFRFVRSRCRFHPSNISKSPRCLLDDFKTYLQSMSWRRHQGMFLKQDIFSVKISCFPRRLGRRKIVTLKISPRNALKTFPRCRSNLLQMFFKMVFSSWCS